MFALGALVIVVGCVIAIPRTGVREIIATETSPELRAVDRRIRKLEEAIERQAKTVQQLREENERLRTAQEALASRREAEVDPDDTGFSVRMYPVPDEVVFLGERLPLERADVYQRFEEEWLRFLVNRHWLVKWDRRVRDVFPVVERKLAAAGMPDDLKYVMVIESGVEARARSAAGAEGWWQFMVGTGNEYGLERSSHVDDRRDLDRATDAAIAHFADLYETFQSWPLVLSAYNAGERRVRESIEEQGEESFYDLVLPTETEAYWFKAAAAKILLEDPERFNLRLGDDGWSPVACDTLKIRVLQARFDLRQLTENNDLTYRRIKELNPQFRRSYLPLGTYEIAVPSELTDQVVASIEGAKLLSTARADQPALAAAPTPDAEGAAEGSSATVTPAAPTTPER